MGDLLGGGAGDDAVHDRDVRGRHHLAGAAEGVAVGVEAFGVLAGDDEVGPRDDGVAPGNDLAGRMLAYRPKCLRIVPLGFSWLVGLRVRRAVVGSEQPAVEVLQRLEGGLRGVRAVLRDGRGTERELVPLDGSTPAASKAASTIATEDGTISGPMPSPWRTPSR